MCVALIGGMDRLERDYINEALRHGVQLKVFTQGKTGMAARLHHMDAIVIFTGKTSHRLRNEALGTAKAKCIPVLMCHSCGICGLRHCLSFLQATMASGKQTAPVAI